MMTVTFATRCTEDNMSLFQNLKLKRPKAQEARSLESKCSSDGESTVENSSCSPDSGSSGGAESPTLPTTGYTTPDLPRHATKISAKHRLKLLKRRSSPDSVGDDFSEARPMEYQRSDIRDFDGGGDEFVSSTPMAIDPRSPADHYEPMSTSPVPPDTSEDRKVDIQSTIHIAPLYAGTDEGCSLGAGGTGMLTMEPMSRSPPPMSRSPLPPTTIWAEDDMINFGKRCLTKSSNKRTSSQNSFVRADEEKLKTVYWNMAAAARENGSSPRGFGSSPREMLNCGSPRIFGSSSREMLNGVSPKGFGSSPREMLRSPPMGGFNSSVESMSVSVDGLLSLSQERLSSGGGGQLSPSPSLRYPSSPSPFNSQLRVSSSGGEMQTLSSSNYPYPPKQSPLNMERLWAPNDSVGVGGGGPTVRRKPDSALDLTKADVCNGNRADSSGVPMSEENEDDEQPPLVCMICDDSATGLHYGIITCEGCKGFFKRTVQNKRVYTCIADGHCEVTKAHRNRCQFCRFQKCLGQGMVLAAVREDRMPGGRNSGAVYNLYKPTQVKYKKKKNKNSQSRSRSNTTTPDNNKMNGYEPLIMNGGGNSLRANPILSSSAQSPILAMSIQGHHHHQQHHHPSSSASGSGLSNTNILKTYLINPAEVAHLRHRENFVSSTRERKMTIVIADSLINELRSIENMDDLSLEGKAIMDGTYGEDPSTTKIEKFSDLISIKLVNYAKSFEFLNCASNSTIQSFVAGSWDAIMYLIASGMQAMYCDNKLSSQSSIGDLEAECRLELTKNDCKIQDLYQRLTEDPCAYVNDPEVLLVLEKVSKLTVAFRRLKLQMEEFLCMKVIIFLNGNKDGNKDYAKVQENYIDCLREFCGNQFPSQPNRVQELLVKITEIHETARYLSKKPMFYVPMLLSFFDGR